MVREEDKETLERIANKLKQLRTAKGVTQESFYNDTNIHIGRIEAKTQMPSIPTLIKICEYFNTSLKEFFSDWAK